MVSMPRIASRLPRPAISESPPHSTPGANCGTKYRKAPARKKLRPKNPREIHDLRNCSIIFQARPGWPRLARCNRPPSPASTNASASPVRLPYSSENSQVPPATPTTKWPITMNMPRPSHHSRCGRRSLRISWISWSYLARVCSMVQAPSLLHFPNLAILHRCAVATVQNRETRDAIKQLGSFCHLASPEFEQLQTTQLLKFGRSE